MRNGEQVVVTTIAFGLGSTNYPALSCTTRSQNPRSLLSKKAAARDETELNRLSCTIRKDDHSKISRQWYYTADMTILFS
jgi:hypothetical protein